MTWESLSPAGVESPPRCRSPDFRCRNVGEGFEAAPPRRAGPSTGSGGRLERPQPASRPRPRLEKVGGRRPRTWLLLDGDVSRSARDSGVRPRYAERQLAKSSDQPEPGGALLFSPDALSTARSRGRDRA